MVTVVLPGALTGVLGNRERDNIEMLLDTEHAKETGPLKLFTGAAETVDLGGLAAGWRWMLLRTGRRLESSEPLFDHVVRIDRARQVV